ncbi:uncharacterized protein Tco025E_07537 [Trypanosoma conorhini]|uniref:Uncharacterized protein n=1 Tax=Trypanosoma conorhini TaxID=83891 RepID=A0A3R7MQG5_9TRYP|nr:uncharacterized protein Tco025E_07537 [Trypanosoma conorhini]RNF06565.1 hypothetical protein Tco025E_07537 [Trypanosoma conorhini]
MKPGQTRGGGIHDTRAGNLPRERASTKKVPYMAGRSSVYPYKAQHFVTAGDQSRGVTRSTREVAGASRKTSSLASSPASKEATQVRFPRTQMEEIASWLGSDTIFAEIELLAGRARELRLRAESLRNAPNAVASVSLGTVSVKRSQSQQRTPTSSTQPPFNEEAYAEQILGRSARGQKERVSSGVSSPPQEPCSAGEATQPGSGRSNGVAPTIEQMISLEQLAYGKSASPQRRRKQQEEEEEEEAEEGSHSPSVVEINEEVLKGSCDVQSPSPSVSSVVQVGVSVSAGTAAESSLGGAAVSLRDASPPRCGALGGHASCQADPYNLVQIPRAHHILSQVNFSYW